MMFFLNVFFLPPSISTCTPTVVAATSEYFIWYHKIKESIKTFGRVFVLYQKKHPFDESFEKAIIVREDFQKGKGGLLWVGLFFGNLVKLPPKDKSVTSSIEGVLLIR